MTWNKKFNAFGILTNSIKLDSENIINSREATKLKFKWMKIAEMHLGGPMPIASCK